MSNNYWRRDNWVKSTLGNAISGAQSWVCSQPANVASLPPSPLALIFADPNGLVPLQQPVVTDGIGHADVYVLTGVYTLVIALGGKIQELLPDQLIGPGSTAGAIVLATNGIPNVNQGVQNLISGAGITLVTDVFGGTTISSNDSLQDVLLIADGVTDNLATINAALAALPVTGGTINLVAIGSGTCYVSGTVTIGPSTKGVVLRGSGWSGNLGNPIASLTLQFAAGNAGIVVNGSESCIIENMLLLSMDAGAISGDNGLWFKGFSGTPTVRNVGVKGFGGHGFLLDSTSGGNIDGWRIDQIYSYGNFGDGLRMQGGSDTSVGVLTGATIQNNHGWGINIDSGSGASSYINPNLAGNVTGGVRVNSSNNKFLGCYVENDSTPSNFVIEAGTSSTTAYFTAFGQPAVIQNLGGASNVIWYHDINGLQGFADLVITNDALGAGPGVRSYTLRNGAFNPNDFTIEDDLGHTWFDINANLAAVLFPQDVYLYQLAGATPSGGISSPILHLLSQFWNPTADSGTVNTSGTAVTWVSGTVFNSGMVGGTIVINSVSYTVATFIDNHDITLTTTAGVQSGVSYTFGISEADNWNVQAIAGSGSNGTSTLKVSHTGTSGVAKIDLEGVETDTSASAGAHGDVPAQVAGYLDTTVNGVAVKIPYYLP